MEYEDQITISAPEGIELRYTLAGLGSRFIAELLDFILRLLVLIALGVLLRVAGASRALTLVVLVVALFLALFGYDIAFEVWGGGRTPGKRWNGLRVLMASGRPVSFAPSAVRNLLRIIDMWATVLVAGIVSILVTGRNQRLGDLAAGTIVVREPRGRGASLFGADAASASPVAPAPTPPGLDATAVSASEVAAIRDFLARREELLPEARARVSQALADSLRGKVGGVPAGGLPPEELLELIAAAKAAR
jgi:uncharacterized RDD family membrane protein YckC